MTKQVNVKELKSMGNQHPEEDATLVSSSARTYSRLIKKEKVRECMRHLRSLINPPEGVERMSTLMTLETALKALNEENARQSSVARGKKQSQSSGGGTQPSNALNTTSNTQSKSSSEGEDMLSFSSVPFTEAKTYTVRLSLSEGEVIAAEKDLLQVLNYPIDSWRGCLLTNFVFDPDIPRLLTCLYQLGQNRKTFQETQSAFQGLTKKNEQFCLRFRVNPSLTRGTFAAPSSDKYQPFLVKVNYQLMRPANPPLSLAPTGQGDEISGRTRITCGSSGIGSEISCATGRPTSRGVGSDLQVLVVENLSLTLARIDHIYPEVFFVPKRNRFATRLTACCHLTNVEPAITSLLGFLPQDLEQVSIFDLVHTSDLLKIYDAYKEVAESRGGSCGRWIHVPPVRWRCCNGTHLLIQTNLRSHIEKSTGLLDFVCGLHEIMKGPAQLDRFFDPTVSLNFSRLQMSGQVHASGGAAADQGELKTPNGAPEEMSGLIGSSSATTGTATAAFTSWMVDPRRLRLKALFNDVSQAELATANALGLPFPVGESDTAPDRMRPCADSVDLDVDSAVNGDERETSPRLRKDGEARRKTTKLDGRTDGVTVQPSLSVAAAARGFSYDAWNHYQHIQRYLASVNREAATADPRSKDDPSIDPDVLISSAVGCASMPPGLHAVGQSLCSSAVVQISDDAQLAPTDLDPAMGVPLVPPAKRWRKGSEAWEEIEGDSEMLTVAEPARSEKVFNANALPLTVDNLQRHTRIQEKHYRQQMLHQLQCQQVHANRSRLQRAPPGPRAKPDKEERALGSKALAETELSTQAVQAQKNQPAAFRYHPPRRPPPGMDNPTSGSEQRMVAGRTMDSRKRKRASKDSSASDSSLWCGSYREKTRDVGGGRGAVAVTATAAAAAPPGAARSTDYPLSEARPPLSRRRRKYMDLGQGHFGDGPPPPPMGDCVPAEAACPPPPTAPPAEAPALSSRQPAASQPPQGGPTAHQAPHMFYGGRHAELGMPPVHFAERYPAAGARLPSSRPRTGRRGRMRTGDHLDLHAAGAHPMPFYVPGASAAQAPMPAGQEAPSRRAHRPLSQVPGVVPGGVPTTPFGLWGLPSWGFVPLMPWHAFPGAPVQWPYYPQVGGALPPYLHGGFFGHPHQQPPQQQQPAPPPPSPPQQPPQPQPPPPPPPRQQLPPELPRQQPPMHLPPRQQPSPLSNDILSPRGRSKNVRGGARDVETEERFREFEACCEWNDKEGVVPPLRLGSPQPSVVVTAHTEDQASEMLSSCGDDGSEEVSSSFVYLLDSSSASNSTRQQQLLQQQQQQQQQLQMQQEQSTAPAATSVEQRRRSRHAPLPQRGQPFWLTDIGSDFTEQTEMRYQIPCPTDFVPTSAASNTKSGSNSSSRQSRLWRCRLGKKDQSEKIAVQVMELLQCGGSCDEDSNGRSNCAPNEEQEGDQKVSPLTGRRLAHRMRPKRWDRGQSTAGSVSSGRESVSGALGTLSTGNSSIKESDGATGSDEGSGLSGLAESQSKDMEPYVECLFVGSDPRKAIASAQQTMAARHQAALPPTRPPGDNAAATPLAPPTAGASASEDAETAKDPPPLPPPGASVRPNDEALPSVRRPEEPEVGKECAQEVALRRANGGHPEASHSVVSSGESLDNID